MTVFEAFMLVIEYSMLVIAFMSFINNNSSLNIVNQFGANSFKGINYRV
ncbi:hypothetical protein [Rummeliibacillus pycnus]|nr:hypothetical protein [Rummeliibacillus pycnus]